MMPEYQKAYLALLEGRMTASREVCIQARQWAEKEASVLADCLATLDKTDAEAQAIGLDLQRLRDALAREQSTPDLFESLEWEKSA